MLAAVLRYLSFYILIEVNPGQNSSIQAHHNHVQNENEIAGDGQWFSTPACDLAHRPRAQVTGGRVQGWRWRVLDPTHDTLVAGPKNRITLTPGDERTGVDIDGQRLIFSPGSRQRPTVGYLYFWHCTAVLARYRWVFEDNIGLLRRLRKQAESATNEVTQRRSASEEVATWDARREEMRALLGVPAGVTKGMDEFWREVVADVQSLNAVGLPGFESHARMAALDWRMEGSKYLPKATDMADAPDHGDGGTGAALATGALMGFGDGGTAGTVDEAVQYDEVEEFEEIDEDEEQEEDEEEDDEQDEDEEEEDDSYDFD